MVVAAVRLDEVVVGMVPLLAEDPLSMEARGTTTTFPSRHLEELEVEDP